MNLSVCTTHLWKWDFQNVALTVELAAKCFGKLHLNVTNNALNNGHRSEYVSPSTHYAPTEHLRTILANTTRTNRMVFYCFGTLKWSLRVGFGVSVSWISRLAYNNTKRNSAPILTEIQSRYLATHIQLPYKRRVSKLTCEYSELTLQTLWCCCGSCC